MRFYSRYYVRSGVGVSARRIGLAMNKFYTKETKNFPILCFINDPKKLFVAQKINLEDSQSTEEGEDSAFPNP